MDTYFSFIDSNRLIPVHANVSSFLMILPYIPYLTSRLLVIRPYLVVQRSTPCRSSIISTGTELTADTCRGHNCLQRIGKIRCGIIHSHLVVYSSLKTCQLPGPVWLKVTVRSNTVRAYSGQDGLL